MSNEIKRIDTPEAHPPAIALPRQETVQWPALVDKENLTTALAPAALRQSLRKVDTPMKAYQSQAPTLAEIRRHHGDKYCMARLAGLLLSLETYLGSQCDLSKEQYIMLAEDVMDKFYALNVADVNLVLRRIMHGESGKIYGKVSPAFIYKAFDDYWQERSSAIAYSHRNSEESIAKHGYDRSEASATEQEVAALYERCRTEYEERKRRDELIALTAKAHLKEVLTTFKNKVKNDTEKNM